MKTEKRILMLLIAFLISQVDWLTWSSTNTSVKAVSKQEQGKPAKDPCWFMTLKDKSIPYVWIKQRQDRDMYGYATEIPLSEAIRIFNEEKQCVTLLAPYPPLTEDELIAAIVAGQDNILPGEALRAQKEALWKIATQKMLPKGSLLVASSGSHVQESPLDLMEQLGLKG